jgi:hypothetical protein
MSLSVDQPGETMSEILERPRNEKPYVLIPVGYPASDCSVPDVKRKRVEEIAVWRQ